MARKRGKHEIEKPRRTSSRQSGKDRHALDKKASSKTSSTSVKPSKTAAPVETADPVKKSEAAAPAETVKPVRNDVSAEATAPAETFVPTVTEKPVISAADTRPKVQADVVSNEMPQEPLCITEYVAPVQTKKKKLKPGKSILIGLALLLLLLVVTVVLFVNGKLSKLNYKEVAGGLTVEEISALNDSDIDDSLKNLELRESGAPPAEGDVFKDKDIINILVCGTDMRIPGTKDLGRCDATIIVSLNKKTGNIKLISFERSIGFPLPGDYEDTKLNNAFNYGGGAYIQETLSQCFLVDLAGYVHLPYETIPQVFDAIGGIEVELDQSEVYNISEFIKYEPDRQELHVGMNTLKGWAAYGYCRLRNADDNWARQSRVRNALQAMVKKLKTMSIADLNNMADSVLPLIGTNLSKKEISSLLLSAPTFINAEVEQMSVPDKGNNWSYQNGRGEHMLGVDFTEWSLRIRSFLYEE